MFNKYSVGNLGNTGIHKEEDERRFGLFRPVSRGAVYAAFSPPAEGRLAVPPSKGLQSHALSSSAWNSTPEVAVPSPFSPPHPPPPH